MNSRGDTERYALKTENRTDRECRKVCRRASCTYRLVFSAGAGYVTALEFNSLAVTIAEDLQGWEQCHTVH